MTMIRQRRGRHARRYTFRLNLRSTGRHTMWALRAFAPPF
jgi:hypothetical protein